MKKNFLLFCALLALVHISQAQTIDSANFQCLYKLTYTKDLLKPEKTQTDELLLLIGANFTSFYSYTNYIADSLRKANPAEYMPQMYKSGEQTIIKAAKNKLQTSDNLEHYFINRNTGGLSCMSRIGVRYYYQYDENTTPHKWVINNSTDTILGYHCQNASTSLGGRNWVVWFTTDITIGEGPWKLRGLPGLILKAEDDDKHYVFECIGIQRLKEKKPISKDTENTYRTISKKEFEHESKINYEDPLGSMKKTVGYVITKDNELSENTKSRKKKYNPIELSE